MIHFAWSLSLDPFNLIPCYYLIHFTWSIDLIWSISLDPFHLITSTCFILLDQFHLINFTWLKQKMFNQINSIKSILMQVENHDKRRQINCIRRLRELHSLKTSEQSEPSTLKWPYKWHGGLVYISDCLVSLCNYLLHQCYFIMLLNFDTSPISTG